MSKIVCWLFVFGFLAMPVSAQQEEQDIKPKEARKNKERPPRIPDAPFVPKRGMVKREKGQFWAGPPDEGRFAQILLLTLVPREQLQARLSEWPNYQELNEAQRARLAERIDEVRQTAQKQALEVAKEFDLQVGPGQEEEFVRMYWMERVQIDQTLREELLTKRRKLEGESKERILKKYPKSVKN